MRFHLPFEFKPTRVGTLPLLAVVVLALGYVAYAAWSPKPPARPDATWTRILDEGAFRIGVDPSFPPFEADDGKGNLSGLDIALAGELVRDWSQQNAAPITVQYVYTGFDGLYDALKAGQFDAIISAIPYDPKKTQDVSFSHSYYNGGPLLIVGEQETRIRTYFDLADKRVGVELGSTGDSFARKWEKRLHLELREYDAPAPALAALRGGQVDAVLTDAIALEDYARTEGGVKVVGQPLVDELIVVAVRRDAPNLLQAINAVIDAMKRDGRLERLQEEWF